MSLTCVSAYFPVKNKHNNAYNNWFINSLAINCPYVFFTNRASIEFISRCRGDLPTLYIICEISDLHAYKYKDKMITHSYHCPSVELNVIWNSKVFMLQTAYQLNPFHSEWFKWIDAGICAFRENPPSIHDFNKYHLQKLVTFPKDKFIFSSSEPYNKRLILPTFYYHYISGTFILHKNMIHSFVEVYKEYLDKLMSPFNIWTEQVILTHIYNDRPELFYKFADGYGKISEYLFS